MLKLMQEAARVGEGLTVCFFCRVEDAAALERNEFYRVDLQILRDLGFQVVVCTRPTSMPSADLYFVWWWTWAAFPLLRAKLKRKPSVIVGTFDHVLPDGTFEYFPSRPLLHRWMIRWSLAKADANIVVSHDQLRLMERSFAVKNLSYSPHVIDTNLYRPGAARDQFFFTICWMHNDNAKRKCLATSIRAISLLRNELPDFKLVIAGEQGSGYPELEELVTELGAADLVEFLGVISGEEKIRLLQTCAVYLQPTLAEGFGVAILEAMSCGAPVITSAVGAVPEVVGDCARFVDGHDVDGLAKAMQSLIGDAPAAAELGRIGRARAVEQFGYHRRLSDIQTQITLVLKEKELPPKPSKAPLFR